MDATSRAASLQPLKTAVQDLFNLYLGGPRSVKSEEPLAGAAGVRKRVLSINKQGPPKDEQFTVDILHLQNQFPDQEQFRIVVESTLATLLVNCSGHMIQVEFLLFVLQSLSKLKLLNWDTFLQMLLRAASATELSSHRHSTQPSANSLTANGASVPPSSMGSTINIPQVSTPAAPASPASTMIGSPPYSASDPSINQSPAKTTDTSAITVPGKSVAMSQSNKVAAWLRQAVCRVILIATEAAELHPVTCFEVLSQTVQWLNTWDAKGSPEEGKAWKSTQMQLDAREWMYNCLEVIKVMTDETKSRLPFYSLLHDRTQLQLEHWPDDAVLFSFFLEVHRRRDKISFYMQMLDQHLHCPTFATQRMVALTYQGAMGEPLHGEDVAATVPKDSIEWERSLRCLRHGLRVIPSSDWWRRVLIAAPRYPQQSNTSTRQGYFASSVPNFVFTAEMTCEAVVDRVIELMQPVSTGITSNQARDERDRWQEWLSFADLFYFLVRHGCVDIIDFINLLATRFSGSEHQTIHSNHVTWLLAQILRLDTVGLAMNNDTKKVETIQKILSFHKEERPSDPNSTVSSQNVLLDFASGSLSLRLWSFNRATEQLAVKHLQKGKQIDEWWKQVVKGERVLDYSSLDEKSMGMIWVLSLTICQPVCDAMLTWMKSNGIGEIIVPGTMNPGGDRLLVIQETPPLPMSLLSGLSLHFCTRLIQQIEEQIFGGQILPSIAMMETYARLLLVAPHTLFRCHLTGMMHKYQQSFGKSGTPISILELLNFRLLPLYRYHGRVKQLLCDIAKIIITTKGKRGEHRIFRLAENLCLNLILSLPEVILVKRELKGAATEFSETLNRAMIINLAFTIKTRGIAEFEQQFILPPAVDQILATSTHRWSEKTLHYFPPVLRDILAARPDKRSQIIQGWQQAEATMIHQCRQLLSPTADPSHLLNYVTHMLAPQHKQYLCAAAFILFDKQPDTVNLGHLSRVLKELSAEDVTSNVYAMVDVLLLNSQLYMQRGHAAQDVLYRVSTALGGLVWNQELFPFDILLLALADRDDDPLALRIVISLLFESQEFEQRVLNNHYRSPSGHEHWLSPGPFHRPDPQQALGGHLLGKDRFPIYFDDICLRMLPTLTLILYRFIENEAFEIAERLLDKYSTLFNYHPTRFTFVRDTLAYFYGYLPSKFILKLLSNLDLTKIPFSDAFLEDLPSKSPENFSEYLSNLLVNLSNVVIPPSTSKLQEEGSRTRFPPTMVSSVASHVPEIPKVFYQHQDPGTYPQLVLETAVIELLSLPQNTSQIVSTLVHIAVKVQPCGQSRIDQSANMQNAMPSNPASSPPPTMDTSNIQKPVASSPLVIQACGLLLSQLPSPFHVALYTEAARIFKECWWMTDPNKLNLEMNSAYAYSVCDPTWAIEDDTSTVIGNIMALLHAFASNLSFEWLEGMHAVITLQRPISSVVQLRIAFHIIGPLLPRLVVLKPLFAKTLALLFTILADVFGQKSQLASPVDINEISDLVDFLHHAVMLEVPVNNGKHRHETLMLCSKAVDRLRPDLQPLFRHLSMDTNASIYAATHPKLGQRPQSPLTGVV